MAEIINLNRVKKARDKSDAKSLAVENRVRFGRTKAEKTAERQSSEAIQRHVDGHKRDSEQS